MEASRSADDVAGAVQERLDAAVTENVSGSGVAVETFVRRGAPWEKLLNVAVEVGADLIVVGATGQRGRSSAANLLGSVAYRVVASSTRSVLISRLPAKPRIEKETRMKNQVWLITGSSRGLGRALAEAVLAAGHKLVATARNPKQLSPLVERYGDQVRAVALDVTDERAAAAAIQAAVDSFGRLDVLVNNAGYGDLASIEDTSMTDFRAQIETNLFGVINVTKAAIPLMRRQGSGHIMQLASVGGRIGPMGRGAYAAAKWGVEGFSEVLQKEIGPFGIKVTIVEPGGFRTDFAGASTNIAAENPIYAATVGATARFQREYNGKQPGDPARAAAALMQIAGLEAPPLRLPLGSDAARAVEEAELARIASDKRWKELSISTDYPPNA